MCKFFPDLLLVCGCPDCKSCVDRELPLPLPAAAPFTAARRARIANLFTSRHIIACALEAPLLGDPSVERAA